MRRKKTLPWSIRVIRVIRRPFFPLATNRAMAGFGNIKSALQPAVYKLRFFISSTAKSAARAVKAI
jgi:hypothetical protein